jgi:hypothetical protein
MYVFVCVCVCAYVFIHTGLCNLDLDRVCHDPNEPFNTVIRMTVRIFECLLLVGTIEALCVYIYIYICIIYIYIYIYIYII